MIIKPSRDRKGAKTRLTRSGKPLPLSMAPTNCDEGFEHGARMRMIPRPRTHWLFADFLTQS